MDNDIEIVERILNGDKQAFARIIDKYKGRVFSLLRRMLGHSPDMQDIAQEVFIKAYNHLNEYTPGHSFSAWLYRIAANRCIDELRKRKRRPDITGFDAEFMQGETPETAYLEKERRQALEQRIMELDQSQRAVFVMRYVQHLSYQEMAERLSVPISTVQMRLYRARQKLRESMSNSGVEGEFIYEVRQS
ncbi:RNA polymerase sigma factor [Paenibacillus ehimensis]|uniref:Sigma-70 family RNA polymerase sigma factor n=1 Tax=Paenibacillus ehimensis TaxID=79264 RepID=A0ABT8V5G9_9BACL|nr:sigma-70 family RNA polymerase sigma factor [Paenibacillus ehimensis]MDO3676681.1 sigma-70 family RNA polymerase sigma factor [Paenibacillus ehimensis]